MNSIILYQLLKDVNCDNEVKKSCYDLIFRFLYYSAKTRKEGLLSVEDIIDEVEEDLIRDAFKTILCNDYDDNCGDFDYVYHLERLDHIMLTQVCASNLHNVELLKQLIIIIGIKEIYSGSNPMMLLQMLSGLLGENHEESLISYIKEQINNDRKGDKIIAELKSTLRPACNWQVIAGDDVSNLIVNQEIGILNHERNNITLMVQASDAFKSKLSSLQVLNFGSGTVFKDEMTVASRINGNLVLRKNILDVMPVFVTIGDVSSNILFLGTVIVNGDVQPGYEVKAAGNVYVYGKADTASINADGDVFIYDAIKD
jgi:hypothetical protein